jgi:uncharacterized protein YaaW (UPF0174 family)
MKPLPDTDLEFLNDVPNEGLKKIVDLLVYDPKDGKKRLSENLSNTYSYNNCYHNNKLHEMVNEIIHEFQLFGADSVVNLFRKHGVKYREILCDICKKNDINIHKEFSVGYMEFELLRKLVIDSVSKSSDDYIDAAIDDLELECNPEADINTKKELIIEAVNNRSSRLKVYHKILSPGSTENSGATKKILQDLALMGVGSQAVRLFVGRSAATFIPGAQFALISWGLFDLISSFATGPAYRVTIPCTILIAILREEMYMEQYKK